MKNKKIQYKEKAIESFLSKNIALVEPNLILKKVQFSIGQSHRPDILAFDSKNQPILVELQLGELDRNHLYRSLEYRDLYFLKYKVKPRVILVAENISDSSQQILEIHKLGFIKVEQMSDFVTIEKTFDYQTTWESFLEIFNVSN